MPDERLLPHRTRPAQCRRAARAAANPRRRRASPTDAHAHLEDVGGKSVLRPRARRGVAATGRSGGSRGGAAASLESGRDRARARRASRSGRGGGGPRRRRARRPDGAPRRGGRRPPRQRPGWATRSRPESWRSMGSGSASPIRCSARRSGHAPHRRDGDRSTRGSPGSLRARRSERGISRSPAVQPSREVAAAVEEAAESAHARGAAAAAAELAELAVRLTPAEDVEDMRRRVLDCADRLCRGRRRRSSRSPCSSRRVQTPLRGWRERRFSRT